MPMETPHEISGSVPPRSFHKGSCFSWASASHSAFSMAALAMSWPRTLAIKGTLSRAADNVRPNTAGAR